MIVNEQELHKAITFVQKNEKIQKLPEKVINLTDKYIEYLDKELQNECTEK